MRGLVRLNANSRKNEAGYAQIARKTIALTLILLGLGAPATAQARHHRPRVARLPDPVAYMRVIAPRFWAAQPCAGNYTATIAGAPASGVGDGAAAWATWFDTGATFTDCHVTLSVKLWPSRLAVMNDWPHFCATFLHETGHLLGYQHDTDPQSVMYPADQARSYPPVCLLSPTGMLFTVDPTGPYAWMTPYTHVQPTGTRPNPATVPVSQQGHPGT